MTKLPSQQTATNNAPVPVTLAFICKDETGPLARMLESVHKHVDELVCAWNGTNEKTKKILERFHVKIVPYKWQNDFAHARSFAFEHASNEIVLWLDADDTLEHADQIPLLARRFNDEKVGALWLYYDYDQDEYGNTTMAVWRERLVRKSWFKWTGAIHEECLKQVDCIQERVSKEQMFVKHHPEPNRIQNSAKRNLEISSKLYMDEHKSGQVDAVNVWHYAKSLNAVGELYDAHQVFTEFTQITTSDEHRYQALNQMASISRKIRQYDRASNEDLEAIKLKPTWPEAYFSLAETAFCRESWEEVLHWANLGFRLKPAGEDLPIPYDPIAVTGKPLQPLVYALVQLGRFQDAYQATLKGLQFFPRSEYFLRWKDQLEAALAQEALETSCMNVYDYLQSSESEKTKIPWFVNSLPNVVRDHPVFLRELNKLKSGPGGDNRLVIYCGNSYEMWDPLSAKTGVGGSEEAVIALSKELVKLGWQVEVFNNCLEEGNYDGVLWQNYYKYDSEQPCAVFVAWRDVRSIMLAPDSAYKALWCHDVQKPEFYTQEQLDRIDKIFVLSEWHRQTLPTFPDEKFWLTTNGIYPQQFDQKIARDPYGCIYASSPDRGLDILLANWPRIKKAVPEARLHVFYGFTKNYDEIHRNDAKMRAFKDGIMKALDQDGVEYHGRVGHSELAQAFLASSVWLYPTYFTEISCITAMKAQAAGVIPVTTTLAALHETVQHGFKLSTDIRDIGTQQAWTNLAIKLLKDQKQQAKIRKEMIPWARAEFAWSTVARKWDAHFKQGVKGNREQALVAS